MYRKDKIAVAVENYKRKYSDEENEDDNDNQMSSDSQSDSDVSKSDDNDNDDDGIRETKKSKHRNKENKREIENVKPANPVVNLTEKNQVAGFNMFLNKIRSGEKNLKQNSNNNNSNNNMNNFNVVDYNKTYYPPNPYTVTTINQSHDLLRVRNTETISADEQNSEDWLKSHNLDALKLTIEDLVSNGKLGSPKPDVASGTAVNCLVYDDLIVTEFEYKLHLAIEMYSKRIKWYLQGSRKMFGLVNGSKLGVLIDSSDSNLGFGRVISFQENLLHLLDEQLYKKKSMNIGFFGTNVKFLWENFMNLNCRVVEEIKEAFMSMTSMGGCNLMQAIKYIVQEKSVDHVLLILGTCPDQEAKSLLYFVQQLLLGRDLPFHCVSYESQSEESCDILKTIAALSGGNYHRYTSVIEELMYTSNDIDLLLTEIERAQEVLAKIGLMRKGQFSSRVNPYINQLAEELKNIPQSESLPQPSSFNDPLIFEVAKFEPKTSNEWLLKSGLKAKKLGLFSKPVLNITAMILDDVKYNSPLSERSRNSINKPKSRSNRRDSFEQLDLKLNLRSSTQGLSGKLGSRNSLGQLMNTRQRSSVRQSFSMRIPPGKVSILDLMNESEETNDAEDKKFIEILTHNILNKNSYESKSEYVPSIGRLVTSSVYEKAMIQVEWPDGTSRNVHADLAQLFEYQKVLGEQVRLMEQRITWLATGSRRIFGTIVEKKVVFILDLSLSNLKYLVHILQSLKLLIQQQLITKEKFNIIAFSNAVSAFKPNLVPVTNENLQDAWTWLKTLNCSGSRNLLGALKHVLENQADNSHNDSAQGIYIFTSGVPDQQIEPLMAYLEERTLGSSAKVHTVLFNVDDYDKSGAPIPSRYANITKTAEIMRTIAHSTKGRFHWFRESGIIESDDIRILMSEIDLAVEYSRRTQQIIKDFKEKYADTSIKRTQSNKLKNEAELCRRDSSDNMVALLPPRPTSLSQSRMKYIAKKNEENTKIPKTLSYKSTFDPRKSVSNTSEPYHQVIQSAFYTEDKNAKGVVYRDYPDLNLKPRKGIGKTVIPDKEEWISSREWMKKYSLKNMGLDLLRLVSGIDCKHEESLIVPLEKFVEAKYCSALFPIVNVKGTRKHMQYSITELNKYATEAKRALIRYMKRLEWLMLSSKRIFGVIIESDVAILLDTSGSMNPHMPELILNLKALIWEQLFKRKINYNIISFNSQIRKFRERLVTPDESNCHSAIGWTEHLVACGNTDTTNALLITLEDPRIQGIYLLTDGKPDSSTEIVINTIQSTLSKRKSKVAIHTISFNCEDVCANDFLKKLSKLSGGRYHKVCHEYDVRMFSQRVIEQCKMPVSPDDQFDKSKDRTSIAANLLSIDPFYPPLPQLEGDDLGRIAKEIQLTRENLSKINYFRELHVQLKKFLQEKQKAKDDNRVSVLSDVKR